jgi:hypothetical protein
MKVLAISAFKRSGKDTMAQHLIDIYGAKRVSFADPLKDMVAQEFGIPRSWTDDPAFKEAPLPEMPVIPQDGFSRHLSLFMAREFRTAEGKIPEVQPGQSWEDIIIHNGQLFFTPRALCILKGSVNRTVRSDYWVARAIRDIKDLESKGIRLITIADLRYKSEAEQLKQAFGKDVTFIRIERFDESKSSDPSEVDLNDFRFDLYIPNRGTMKEFVDNIDAKVAYYY